VRGTLVELEAIAEEDKTVLANLVQLYRHDLSEFRGYELSEHGTFVYRFLDHYWVERGRHAFFIRVDGRLGGFVLACEVEGDAYEVAEFFVTRHYRREGVGLEAALALFSRLPGRWSLFHDDANWPAASFWSHVVGRASGGVFDQEQVTSSAGFVGQRYRFTFPSVAGEDLEAGGQAPC
jgi:predicted acetyltransferase